MGRATARPPVEYPDEIRAPLFEGLVAGLDPAQRFVVLDLGAASTAMLGLLSGYRCRVEIAGLTDAEFVASINAATLDADLDAAAVARTAMPAGNGEPADLILCWDLLNYLNREAIATLVRELSARARPGAVAHALMAYAEARMPARPGRFEPLQDRRLVNRLRGSNDIPAPRYTPEELGRLMDGFSIERGRLLANGMQEFAFRKL